MAQNIRVIVYPAKDIEGAKTFFAKFLGVEPYADTPYYVGFRFGDLEIGLDPNGQATIAYIDVTNIEESLKAMQEAGAVIVQEPKDVSEGLLVAQVKDTNGNIVGFRQQPN